MSTLFHNHVFDNVIDREPGSNYSAVECHNCRFVGCAIIARDPSDRQSVRDIRLHNCDSYASALQGVIIENVVVDHLKVGRSLIVWASVFKHVVLKGKIGPFTINSLVPPNIVAPGEQEMFDAANEAYYRDTDWALDISEGIFAEADIRGVPAKLIRRDPATQVVVLREKALEGRWKQIDLSKTYWATSIQFFLQRGDSPLHYAARSGHVEVAKVLLAQQANIEAPDRAGARPLLYAAFNGRLNAVEFLLDRKAEVTAKSKTNVTALHAASLGGHADVAKALLKRSADIEARDGEGLTPLHDAAMNGHVEVAKVLIAHHANIEAPDKTNTTPLQSAALNGHSEMVKFLLAHNAKIETQRETGATALHQAAVAGYADVVELLLDHKANIEAKTKRNDTPLHLAAGGGHVEVVKSLLNRKADAAAKNADGRTPLPPGRSKSRPLD
jgi:ankyrin repeat protein